jgi:hypothetical protein
MAKKRRDQKRREAQEGTVCGYDRSEGRRERRRRERRERREDWTF